MTMKITLIGKLAWKLQPLLYMQFHHVVLAPQQIQPTIPMG
jgi:hypothetical protein